MPSHLASTHSSPARGRHRGWLTMELGVAATLLVLTTITFSRMAYSIQVAREAQYLRQVAMECLQQAVDQVFAAEPDALTRGGLATMQLPEWAAAQLPDGILQADLRPDRITLDGEIAMQITIRWNSPAPQRVETTLYRYVAKTGLAGEEASP